ncbi:response regulator [Vibrio sp. MA40-2]|uniref:response regulator n=1 Tax=Vibrio sp. MA40-2 TaxID=3391828 RepID=UPI0039A7327E
MTVSVLICDDSNIARKQLKKALPDSWQSDVTLVTNGEEALDALKAGSFDVLFLDLTMPVLDGFEVLIRMQSEGIQVKTFVVSADLQAEAKRRVEANGALDFITKPASATTILDVLNKHNLL